jgi:hypothetical protein
MGDDATARAVPLGRRFPGAWQFFRMRLIDEIFPITAAVGCWAEPVGEEEWQVCVSWSEIAYRSCQRFSGDELRGVYGRWSSWARACTLDMADRLPV